MKIAKLTPLTEEQEHRFNGTGAWKKEVNEKFHGPITEAAFVSVPGVPKPFVFTPHALNRIRDRLALGDPLKHLEKFYKSYMLTTGLSSNMSGGKLVPTVYLKHDSSNAILVLVHGREVHTVVTAYPKVNCTDRLRGKTWIPFDKYEWSFA